MKTKIKRHSRSVISIILALSLILTSSVAAMFVANAVTLQDEKVGAKVVEEGEVGASVDDEDVAATRYGGPGIWGLWAGTSDRDGMSTYWQLTADGTNTVSVVKTLTNNDWFFSLTRGTTENWHYNYQWSSDATFTNNYTSAISGAAWQTQTYYVPNSSTSYDVHRLKFWCNANGVEVKISVNTITMAITVAPTVTIPDVADTVSISADSATVTTEAPTSTLTATASSVPAALNGQRLTYTFYAGDTRLGSTTGVVTSGSSTATYTVSQADARTVDYKVTVSYTGYNPKTSGTVTVTNSDISEPVFNLLGSYCSDDWSTGQAINTADTAYTNVYYKEINVTVITQNSSSNRFRIKNTSTSKSYASLNNEGVRDGESYRYTMEIDDNPFTCSEIAKDEAWQNNYIQINPTKTGTYRIYVDQTNTSAPKVWVEGERDILITTQTTFYSSVTTSGSSKVVTPANRSSFENASNTAFKGFVSGTVWQANGLTDYRPFMLSTKKGVDYSLEYAIRKDLCSGVDFVQEHVMVGDEEDGEYAWIYKIKSNVVNTDKRTKNIILHLDTEKHEIWATSTFDQTGISDKTVTNHSDKKVKYYFAVLDGTNSDCYNKFVKSGKLYIHYWNNSLPHGAWNGNGNYYDYVAANPVNSSGSTSGVTDKTDNKIYVDMTTVAAYEITGDNSDAKGSKHFTFKGDKGYGGTTNFNRLAYIYCAEIPVWATSFAFADNNGYSYLMYDNSSNFSERGIVLNPNRVYLAFNSGEHYYTTAVRLDQSLWDENTAVGDDEAAKFIKTFKTNLIKYNATTSGDNKDLNPTMNKALRNEYYSRGIENELYFGGFWDYDSSTAPTFADSVKPITWKAWNNLAQRKTGYVTNKFAGEIAYYAAVWDLAGNVLDKSSENNLGGWLLTDTYQKAVLPFFDYDTLSTSGNNIGTVYKNVDFPFYKTTYNGVTSYSYDSMSDYNREYNTTGTNAGKYTFTKYEDLNKMQGYKPFSDQDKSFANEFVIDFYMTPTGNLKTKSGGTQDIAFNFSGDDDVWVYIDGVKVLDLGGAHMISAGTINLTDMKAYYKTTAKTTTDSTLNSCQQDYAVSESAMYTVDLAKLFEVYGVNFDRTDASTQHKLQMFYTERGENESNCSISFNLPQNSGLRIQNEIDTSGVNTGLVDATLWAANKDYFSYYIENKTATTTQRDTALAYSGYGVSNLPAVATAAKDPSFYTTDPKFPYLGNSETVNRVSQGLTQLLLAAGLSTGSDSEKPTLNTTTGYFSTNNLNYKLTDSFKSGEIDDTLSGRTVAKSETNGATLNLLYGESATFESKFTPHTWLVVKQENALYYPSDDSETITRGDPVIKDVDFEDQRNASRFYSTSYTITDDSSTKIMGTDKLANNGEVDVVAHASDNSDGYYFSNYTNTSDADENVAATYKFVNAPHTGTITISKEIDAGDESPDEKASFWFDVTFDNVFGVDDGDSNFVTHNVKYTVHTLEDKFVEREYDTTNGIMLRHGESATISGIPAGTLYKVIERSRGGYSLDTVTKTSYRNGVQKKQTVMHDAQQYEKASDIDHLRSDDTGAYLATFEYVNKKVAMKIVLHYYDRKMQNGVPVNIDTTPTTATVSYQNAPEGYEKYTTGDDPTLIWVDTKAYITNAVEGKLDNVVDQYFYWTTNTEASGSGEGSATGIRTKKHISYTKNSETGRYDKTLTPYASTAYHLDAYGDPLPAAEQTEANKWITYTGSKGENLTASFTDAVINDASGATTATVELYNKLAQIDVWVYNEPKEYTVTVYGAETALDLNDVNNDGSVMVGNGRGNNTGTVTDYYNTRFGETAGEGGSTIDAASDYMQHYGRLTSFTGSYPSDLVRINRVIGDYKFVGWATDPKGEDIYTTDYYCGYRILSDMRLYPVYMKNPTAGFGLTIVPNVKDTYIASTGTEYTRLNVTYNPYNTTGDKDENIKEVAMVNVRMADSFDVSMINLSDLRTAVKNALDALPKDGKTTHTITVNVTYSGNDITKPVTGKDYNANEVNYSVTFDDADVASTVVKLNNKNRVMLTQTYNSSLLANGKSCNKLLVLGAMKYHDSSNNTDNWTISSNYLYYLGGECR